MLNFHHLSSHSLCYSTTFTLSSEKSLNMQIKSFFRKLCIVSNVLLEGQCKITADHVAITAMFISPEDLRVCVLFMATTKHTTLLCSAREYNLFHCISVIIQFNAPFSHWIKMLPNATDFILWFKFLTTCFTDDIETRIQKCSKLFSHIHHYLSQRISSRLVKKYQFQSSPHRCSLTSRWNSRLSSSLW